MSRLGREIRKDRFFKGFTDWWDESDPGRIRWTGPWLDQQRAQSSTSTQISEVEVGYWYGLLLFKMSKLDLFRLKMDSNQLPNLLPVFRRHFISSSGTAKKVCVFQEDAYDFYAWQCSIASDERIMTWPPSSPDLDPIENLWVLLQWGIYSEGN